MDEPSEVVRHAHGDQAPKSDEELALLRQVRLAGLPDDEGDPAHGLMHRKSLGLQVLPPAEKHADMMQMMMEQMMQHNQAIESMPGK